MASVHHVVDVPVASGCPMSAWHFLVQQGVPGLVIGSLATSAVLGTWTQIVTGKRHKQRMVQNAEQHRATLLAIRGRGTNG